MELQRSQNSTMVLKQLINYLKCRTGDEKPALHPAWTGTCNITLVPYIMGRASTTLQNTSDLVRKKIILHTVGLICEALHPEQARSHFNELIVSTIFRCSSRILRCNVASDYSSEHSADWDLIIEALAAAWATWAACSSCTWFGVVQSLYEPHLL